jgi:sulfite reductase (NADPH) hemoprotein beta-component
MTQHARIYRYDEFDEAFLQQRVAQFRDQVKRRVAGEITEEQFRPLRLMNGLYHQLHAYMLRIAIPYGVLSSAQLRGLAHVARTYDRGFGHFTTRQNIQFNWIRLDQIPDAMADLARVHLHGIQTSGNCIRNTTADQFAGAAADEIEDPRVWCEIIRQWSTLHPEFSFLPRKFKIAVTGAPKDRAAVRAHDIGLRLHRNAAGEAGFEVMVGGGLGRTPFLAKTVREFLPPQHLLSYLEAILRVYNQYGRRDNIYKARIKILVHEIGVEKLREEVEVEWAALRDGALTLPSDVVDAIGDHFAPPPFAALDNNPAGLRTALADRAFARWHRNNVFEHRQPGYAIVVLSLKPQGGAPGDATADQMDAVADLADRHSFGEIRVAHEQDLVLPHVPQRDLPALWRALDGLKLATPNIGKITDIIACPGLDYCSLANARSIPIAQELTHRFADLDLVEDIGRLHINISGCINACGHHHVGHIGLLGVDKHGAEAYQIQIGGKADEDAAIGTILGPALPYEETVDAVERVVRTYLDIRRPGELFIDTVKRVGVEPFKERVYETA